LAQQYRRNQSTAERPSRMGPLTGHRKVDPHSTWAGAWRIDVTCSGPGSDGGCRSAGLAIFGGFTGVAIEQAGNVHVA